MQCPRCDGPLEQIDHNGTIVDRCQTCYGLWFDMIEPEKLRKIKNVSALDIGTPNEEHIHDDLKVIDCPKCKTRMTRLVDNIDPNLTYRKCPVCYGVWFDAGTFRAYQAQGGLLGVIRRLLP